MKRMESCKGTRPSQRLSLRVRLWISRALLGILTNRTRRWLKEIWVQERSLNLNPGASSSLSQEQLSSLCSTMQAQKQDKLLRMIPELKKAKKLFKVPGDITLAEIVDGMERDEILEKLDLSAFPVTLGVLADKMSTHVDNDNIVSFGSAARGHVLEADFFTRCPDVWKVQLRPLPW